MLEAAQTEQPDPAKPRRGRPPRRHDLSPDDLAKLRAKLSVDVIEASLLSGVSVKALRRDVALGRLRSTKLGPRQTRIVVADLEAYLGVVKARRA